MSGGGRDVISGGILLLASLVLLALIPGQVETTEGVNLTPAFIPTVMAIAIACLATVLLIQGIIVMRAGAPAQRPVPAGRRVRAVVIMLGVVVVIAAQAALLTRLGYIGASALALIALALLYGHRRWWHIAILCIAAPPAILVFFRYTMLVLLPQGTWFE